jgi:hypothetical protein
MPFTSGLSQRLARLRRLGLLTSVATLAACLPLDEVVSPGQPQVMEVVVSPNPVTLQPFQSLQFRAFGRTPTGDSVSVAVSWSGSGGTISPSGVYTAGPTPGTYRVTAAHRSRSLTGSASVTVFTPPWGTWPNEPAGFSLISDYDFGAPVPATNRGDPLGTSGWQVWRNTAGRGTLAVDDAAPLSAPDAFQFLYPIGFPSGQEPAMVEYVFRPRVQELYWGFWWKPSNPFQSDWSGVNKIAFVWTPSGSTDLLYFDLSPDPWRIRAMDDLFAGGGPDAGKRNEPNVTTTVIRLGQWHRIEIYVKYSTGSNANGIVRWWVDGVLNGNYTNLKMVQDGGFDHVQFAPTFGGNTGDVKTENDYYWLDHVRISRAP